MCCRLSLVKSHFDLLVIGHMRRGLPPKRLQEGRRLPFAPGGQGRVDGFPFRFRLQRHLRHSLRLGDFAEGLRGSIEVIVFKDPLEGAQTFLLHPGGRRSGLK